jgi:hypothetical protein
MAKKKGNGGDDDQVMTAVRHFRLSEPDADVWDKKVMQSGMTASAFFRTAVIENQTIVQPPRRPVHVRKLHPATQQIIHLLAKQGNNINQLARHLNLGRKAGELSERDYKTALDELHELNENARVVMKTI